MESRLGRFVSLDGTALAGRESEFYWLWILATTTYGVGDVVTTIAIWSVEQGVTELNALVAFALSTVGRPGLVGLKLLVFGAFLLAQVAILHAEDPDWLSILGPPLLLGAIGLVVTGYNLWLLALA
jgi:hypothetical protein